MLTEAEFDETVCNDERDRAEKAEAEIERLKAEKDRHIERIKQLLKRANLQPYPVLPSLIPDDQRPLVELLREERDNLSACFSAYRDVASIGIDTEVMLREEERRG